MLQSRTIFPVTAPTWCEGASQSGIFFSNTDPDY
jgi:hypothetical protein